jgi:DNA-binding CsgD family transcriptional regulator
MTDATTPADPLRRGRDAFAHRAWTDAYVQLSTADRRGRLQPHDIELLAMAAYLTGRDAESAETWARVHQRLLGANDYEGAARCAFWLGFQLYNAGESTRGSGWMARAQRSIERYEADSVVSGYLRVSTAIQRMAERDAAAALEMFRHALKVGERFRDGDLVALARHGCGRALIRLGDIAEGVGLLDEVMVGITANEVSSHLAGDIYCSVIEACHETFDWRRAQDWTSALSDWCASQPDLVPYRGQCLVRRAEVLQLRGAWPDAMQEAARACERLSAPRQPALGAAFYQCAELHRLRGEFTEAAHAYRAASEAGRNAQPGLSLLRLAEGKIDTASAAIRNALDGVEERRARARLLGAYVEIMLAARLVDKARAGATELSDISAAVNTPFLAAAAAHATGAVLLAENHPREARTALAAAWTAWRQLGAVYEEARTRALIGLSCWRLGDHDGAELEFEAASHALEGLGATPDVAHLDALRRTAVSREASGLTPREMEVLRLLATGKTNRMIAEALRISEKTVIRHVSNIFNKLDVPSRAAATAYAHQHRLV